ncbi:pyridoxal phosphate-dependent decarboxylase family protein [Zwartia panacis]|uniref:pyridoxal phosphate-dependent decarboxylase family protein n=1 Tax=Zwartia panacis TaxID=2683345 RepID=UPI0025B4B283|nr:aminotransferase class V-fold PLP-dependent enzyme [Zwartia panacis]MDN4016098.1 aminotransferase class V-fold PLP-dependent enzyme [Zwartia panacis]
MSRELDQEFMLDREALAHAVALMGQTFTASDFAKLGTTLPESGIGSIETLDQLAPIVLGRAARLDAPTAFAHKDPPTPWVTWATTLWNASLNQNLLHPATAPVARELEEKVIEWLAPYFGMSGGHMTPGSSAANLTALWAARECADISEVIASEAAHLSIKKSAHILGLRFTAVPVDDAGVIREEALPTDMHKAALVLTSGSTSVGALDPLTLIGRAAWTHVDAAWGGPLRLTRYADRLAGIEHADSVAVSSHKWLFQPKESALVFFRDSLKATEAISFGGAYLTEPNVGLLGSHGATAVPLLAMLLSWGRAGVAQRIEHCMMMAQKLADFIRGDDRLELFAMPTTGLVVWRARDPRMFERLLSELPIGMTSTVTIGQRKWLRNTAANPNADIELMIHTIKKVLGES